MQHDTQRDGPSECDDSPSTEAQNAQRSHEELLFEHFGVKPEFLSDEAAPPVNRDLIRLLVEQSLPVASRDAVIAMLARYRSWYEAWEELLRGRP